MQIVYTGAGRSKSVTKMSLPATEQRVYGPMSEMWNFGRSRSMKSFTFSVPSELLRHCGWNVCRLFVLADQEPQQVKHKSCLSPCQEGAK